MTATDRRRAAERKGRAAETLAALFLRLKGYRVVARRFRTPVGEIDLVMQRASTLVFVEVKKRAFADDAVLAVTPAARQRLVRAAEAFLGRHPEAAALTLRFDVVALAPRSWPRHIVDAFGVDR
jgi:putative endonuclease